MLDGEWTICKAAMEKWMAAANFDGEGKQIRGLRAIREEMLGVEGWKERETLQAKQRQPPGLMDTMRQLVFSLQSQWVWLGAAFVVLLSLFRICGTQWRATTETAYF